MPSPNVRFESLSDLLDYAKGAENCPNAQALPRVSVDDSRTELGVPISEAFILAQTGWGEGRARMQENIDAAPSCHVRKNRIAWNASNAGGPLDIGSYFLACQSACRALHRARIFAPLFYSRDKFLPQFLRYAVRARCRDLHAD